MFMKYTQIKYSLSERNWEEKKLWDRVFIEDEKNIYT